jgi:hypothetical protein
MSFLFLVAEIYADQIRLIYFIGCFEPLFLTHERFWRGTQTSNSSGSTRHWISSSGIRTIVECSHGCCEYFGFLGRQRKGIVISTALIADNTEIADNQLDDQANDGLQPKHKLSKGELVKMAMENEKRVGKIPFHYYFVVLYVLTPLLIGVNSGG